MSDASDTEAAQPAAALGAYAAALFRSRRVGVLGDATSPLAERLVAKGARLVHVYDPDPGRLAVAAAKRAADGAGRAQRPVLALFGDDLGVRDGAFDVLLVPDLSLFDDPQEIIRRTRKLVSPSGVCIIASPNPDAKRFLLAPAGSASNALGYYELYDAVSLQFPDVKMLGQAPFVGYSIVDFSESDPDVSVDTSLLDEPETPEWYVAVSSDRRVSLDAYSLVELPLAAVRVAAAPSEDHPTLDAIEPETLPPPATLPPVTIPRHHPAARPLVVQPTIIQGPPPPPPGPSDAEVALTAAQTRISVLLTENETLREQVKDHARADRAAEMVAFRAAELEREVEDARAKAKELERLLEADRARFEQVQAESYRHLSDFEVERHARESSDTQLAAARKKIAELEAQVAAYEPPTLRSKEMQQKLVAALDAQKQELAVRENELVARVRELEGEITRLKGEAQEAGRRAAHERDEAERRARSERSDLSRKLEAAVAERAEIARKLDAADRAAADLREQLGRVTEMDAKVQALEAELVATRAREQEHVGAAAPLEQEIRRLEGALRDRGHDVVRLQRELIETERFGRELLFELEDARKIKLTSGNSDAGGASFGSGGASAPEASGSSAPAASASASAPVEARSSDLVERAARAEADLLAANWKIARLEREATRRARAEGSDPTSSATRELEIALTAAQREIALLRAGGAGEKSPGEENAALIEDALLLGQLERERRSEREIP